MARLLLDRNQVPEALDVLRRIPPTASVEETVDAAILQKRAKDFVSAHRLFAEAYSLEPNDPKIMHEFAQTKLRLAGLRKTDLQTKKRLDREAAELLRRTIQLSDDPTRLAWAWIDLANALEHLNQPHSEVEAAYLKARALLPHQQEFVGWYEKWKERASARSGNGRRSFR